MKNTREINNHILENSILFFDEISNNLSTVEHFEEEMKSLLEKTGGSPVFFKEHIESNSLLKPYASFIQSINKCLPNLLVPFSFIDFWYPLKQNPYNAIYLVYEGVTLIQKNNYTDFSQKLAQLYKDENSLGDTILDSNKIIQASKNGISDNIKSFIISKNKFLNKHNENNEYTSYFIQINEIIDRIKRIDGIYEIIDSLGKPYPNNDYSKYTEDLKRLKNKFENENIDSYEDYLSPKLFQLFKFNNELLRSKGFSSPFASFLTYLVYVTTITPYEEWNEYIYFPCSSIQLDDKEKKLKSRWIGGVLLPFQRQSTFEERYALRNAFQTIIPSIYLNYSIARNERALQETQKYARKAAISQVLARNMSHNHGSHVLSRMIHKDQIEGILSEHEGIRQILTNKITDK